MQAAISNLNVTPLIDVLLVLLIIFMVIAPAKPVGLETTVPQPPADGRAARLDPAVVVGIDQNLGLTINTQPTDFERLGGRLAEIFKTRADRVVFVKAHADVEFRYVARAIDIAKGMGIDRIGLL